MWQNLVQRTSWDSCCSQQCHVHISKAFEMKQNHTDKEHNCGHDCDEVHNELPDLFSVHGNASDHNDRCLYDLNSNTFLRELELTLHLYNILEMKRQERGD